MDYSKLASKVDVLINTFGASYNLKKIDNSSAGSVMAVLDEQFKRDEQGVIKARKVMLISGISSVKPEVGMYLEDDKTTYRIQSVETIRPASTVMLFEAVVT